MSRRRKTRVHAPTYAKMPSRTPRAVSRTRVAGVALLGAKLALVPVVFDPAALYVFALPKALLSFALAVLVAGVLLALVLQEGRQVIPRGRAQAAAVATVLTYTASAAFARDHVVAVFGAPDRLLGLTSILDGAILYFACLVLVRTRGQFVAVLIATITGASVVLAYALVQRLGLDPLQWSSTPGTVRPFSSLGNPGVLAQYLGPLGAGFLALAAFCGGLRRLERIALAVIACSCVLGVLITGTRASFIGFAFGAIAFAAVSLQRSRLKRRPALLGAAVAIVVFGLATVVVTPVGRLARSAVLDGLNERASLATATLSAAEPTREVENSLLSRIVLYEIAGKQLLDRPILGVGPDNFVAAYPQFRPAGIYAVLPTTAPQTSTHSWVAKLLSDAGLAGTAAFAALLGLSIWAPFRRGLTGPNAGGLAALAFYLGGGLVSVNDIGTEWLLWVSLALLVTPVDAPAMSLGRRPGSHGRLVLLVLGAALLVALWSAFALTASHAAADSRSARARNDTAAAIAAGERSVSLDALRAEYWHGLGLSYAAGRRFPDAVRAFERAVELAPYHVTYHSNLAKAHLVLAAQNAPGASGRALAAAARAVEIDPNNGEAYYTLALVAEQTGDHAGAAQASERGLQLLPRARDIGSYEIAGRAYFALQRYSEAERWLRLGIPFGSTREVASLHLLLARALAAQGRLAEARAEVERVLSVDPANAAALRIRAEIDGLR